MSESLPKSPLEAQSKAVPLELEQIYGNKVPSGVLEMYAKLKDKLKKESYVAKLTADEAEKKKRRTPRSEPQTKEKHFNPHLVASAQTVEEQRQAQEMQENLARMGVIPPESVEETDVDINGIRVPQYKKRINMQRDMSALNNGDSAVLEGTRQELREKLKKLVEKFAK